MRDPGVRNRFWEMQKIDNSRKTMFFLAQGEIYSFSSLHVSLRQGVRPGLKPWGVGMTAVACGKQPGSYKDTGFRWEDVGSSQHGYLAVGHITSSLWVLDLSPVKEIVALTRQNHLQAQWDHSCDTALHSRQCPHSGVTFTFHWATGVWAFTSIFIKSAAFPSHVVLK